MNYLRRIFVLAVLLLSAGASFAQPVKDSNAYRNAPKVLQAFREIVAKPSEAKPILAKPTDAKPAAKPSDTKTAAQASASPAAPKKQAKPKPVAAPPAQ